MVCSVFDCSAFAAKLKNAKINAADNALKLLVCDINDSLILSRPVLVSMPSAQRVVFI